MEFVWLLELAKTLLPILIPLICPDATMQDVLVAARDPKNRGRKSFIRARARQLNRQREGRFWQWKQFLSEAERDFESALNNEQFQLEAAAICGECGVAA